MSCPRRAPLDAGLQRAVDDVWVTAETHQLAGAHAMQAICETMPARGVSVYRGRVGMQDMLTTSLANATTARIVPTTMGINTSSSGAVTCPASWNGKAACPAESPYPVARQMVRAKRHWQ
ncbi:hypothetical protein ColTof4_03037 [Colletotrichum tofieldiae]|nr:hypothetical protein ColTof3_13557 [Colletotrichum tofieldiae]GKT70614.1 hypothetical protein ColTof4_03037 [Colletotrichum tofieldiae]GKT94513.1 hypothetical protein Ct61P_12363 [Colletotrichum tofieldiae]